jgi:hypothetical protein
VATVTTGLPSAGRATLAALMPSRCNTIASQASVFFAFLKKRMDWQWRSVSVEESQRRFR